MRWMTYDVCSQHLPCPSLSVRNKMPQNLDQHFTMTGETGSYRCDTLST